MAYMGGIVNLVELIGIIARIMTGCVCRNTQYPNPDPRRKLAAVAAFDLC